MRNNKRDLLRCMNASQCPHGVQVPLHLSKQIGRLTDCLRKSSERVGKMSIMALFGLCGIRRLRLAHEVS